MTSKPLLGVLGLSAAFAALIGLWTLRPGMTPPQTAVTLQSEPDCDSAQQPCRAHGDDLEISLRLGPPVRPLESFNIELRGELEAAARIDVQFLMRGMDMGLNRYRLGRDADGVWRGRAVLPVCTTGRSDWYAVIGIEQGGRRWIAELPFVAGSP